MKILYLITKSELGGAGVHVLDLSIGMQSRGHSVALMCPSGYWLDKEFCKTNNNFYPNNYLGNTINPFKIIRSCFAIAKAINDFKPDIISCHSSMAGIIGRFVASFYSFPKVVFTAHSWAFTDGSSFTRKIFMIPLERIFSKYTDKIICVSEFDKNIAIKYKITKLDKLVVIHNGVKNQGIKNFSTNEIFKIVTVMRLSYPKLPELLIESFNLLPRNTFELSIIGYGEKYYELNKMIIDFNLKDEIKIFNSLKKEDVINFLRDSDLFILLSKHEGLPLTILEAMSVGLPVIASNVGGIKEEINESCGILVDNNDINIKDSIIKITSDFNILKEMSQNAWKRQRDFFSVDVFIENTEKVYKNLFL